jgi:hypothetical protein
VANFDVHAWKKQQALDVKLKGIQGDSA